MSNENKLVLMTTINEALISKLNNRDNKIINVLDEEKELIKELEISKNKYENEKLKIKEITYDMTRQHRSMQEGLLDKINNLNRIITDLKDELEKERVLLEETKREKDEIIGGKEAEINEMKIKMEQISNEFADMLKEVLDKMNDKIEIVDSTWENESGVPIIKKLEEFSADNSK